MQQSFKLPTDQVETVRRALAEDIGSGDITTQLIAPTVHTQAQVISREPAILCGTAWVDEVFNQLDQRVKVTWHGQDGAEIVPNQTVCTLKGPARALLTGERIALNFLQLLSAVATQTHHYVQIIQGTSTRILDTRKTVPGLRSAQKYAVRCGGGLNHRMGLYDAFLIKENHIAAAGSITQAVQNARQFAPQLPIEVEVETLAQIQEALDVKVERLLLDNFSISLLRQAVLLVNGRAELEASGGINKQTLREVAETGVNYISVGALTKHIQAIDLSMRIKMNLDC